MRARCGRVVVLATLLAACDAGAPPAPPTTPAPVREVVPLAIDAAPSVIVDAAVRPSLDRVDLDGDGVFDEIAASFSGGAHCCYSLAITPSKSKARVVLPFELDGGYVGGLDLSQPRVFNIADYDGDGIVEICAQIQTYNGEENPLPRAWTKRYGIRDHGAATCEPT